MASEQLHWTDSSVVSYVKLTEMSQQDDSFTLYYNSNDCSNPENSTSDSTVITTGQ
jgi:hypothetical protein